MQRKSTVEARRYEVARVVFRFSIREATGAFEVLLAGEREQHVMHGKRRQTTFLDKLATIGF